MAASGTSAAAVAGILALALGAGPVRAEEPVEEEPIKRVVDELYVGDLVYTQPRGKGQLAVLSGWEKESGDTYEVAVSGQYGVTDRFTLGAEIPYQWVRQYKEQSQGLGSVDLELLYGLYQDGDTQRAVSTRLGIGLPAIDKSREDGRAYSYEPALIAYQGFANGFVNAAGGVEIEDPTGSGEPTEARGFFDFALARAWRSWVGSLEAEVSFGNGPTEVIVAPGLTWKQPLAGGDFEAGVGMPVGLTSASPDMGVVLKMTYRFVGGE